MGHLNTVEIWNPDMSSFWMVKKRLALKWFRFWTGSEIQQPNHSISDQMAAILDSYLLGPFLNSRDYSYYRCPILLIPNHPKSKHQNMRYSNVQYSSPPNVSILNAWCYVSKEHQHQRARTSGNLVSVRHHLALPQINKKYFKQLFLDLLHAFWDVSRRDF